MLTRTGTVTAVTADQVTVQMNSVAVCLTCPGCSGLRAAKITLPSSEIICKQDQVSVGINPQWLTRLTFNWFALPVIVLVAILIIAEKFGVPEMFASLFGLMGVITLFGILARSRAQGPNPFHVVPSLNNQESDGSK